MKKLLITIALCVLPLGVIAFNSKFYYPKLPIESMSKKEVVESITQSSKDMVKVAEENGYEWFITRMEQGKARENLKEMISKKGWKFKEQMGSGYIFEKKYKRLIAETEMWTGNFVTNAKSTGKIESGNEFTEDATTSGKFVILDMKIKNNKKEALTIDSSYFKIKTQDGTTFEPVTSGEVMMAMGPDANDFFMTQINPGLSKSGKVVFEVAKDMKLENTVLQAQTGFFGTESIEINLK